MRSATSKSSVGQIRLTHAMRQLAGVLESGSEPEKFFAIFHLFRATMLMLSLFGRGAHCLLKTHLVLNFEQQLCGRLPKYGTDRIRD